jgi:hypothetical protein
MQSKNNVEDDEAHERPPEQGHYLRKKWNDCKNSTFGFKNQSKELVKHDSAHLKTWSYRCTYYGNCRVKFYNMTTTKQKKKFHVHKLKYIAAYILTHQSDTQFEQILMQNISFSDDEMETFSGYQNICLYLQLQSKTWIEHHQSTLLICSSTSRSISKLSSPWRVSSTRKGQSRGGWHPSPSL